MIALGFQHGDNTMLFLTLRVARPVTSLVQSSTLYCRGLGLEQLGAFTDHDGFSGIMLGQRDLPWHLEFTQCDAHPLRPTPTQEDMLVLYLPDEEAWLTTCGNMLAAGFCRLPAVNPYWDRNGQTFCDHDGYRTVIQRQSWPSLTDGQKNHSADTRR